MGPVLEIVPPEGFALWPVGGIKRFGFLGLGGDLTEAEVGTAVMGIAGCNDIDPDGDGRPPRPPDPLGSFLHGLLTFDTPFAAGGLRVTDDTTGAILLPGCCTGLEDWRDWYAVLDGNGYAGFGHDPSPTAELHGDRVLATVDAEQPGGPVIELPASLLRELLAGAERDLRAFLDLSAGWANRHLPGHAGPVVAAIARVLDLPSPVRG